MRAQDRRSWDLTAAVDLPARARGSIDAEAFLTGRTSGRMARQECTVGRRAYSGSGLCEGSAEPT
jgi:hypothetical protein